MTLERITVSEVVNPETGDKYTLYMETTSSGIVYNRVVTVDVSFFVIPKKDSPPKKYTNDR